MTQDFEQARAATVRACTCSCKCRVQVDWGSDEVIAELVERWRDLKRQAETMRAQKELQPAHQR